jgi:hypothetical protein
VSAGPGTIIPGPTDAEKKAAADKAAADKAAAEKAAAEKEAAEKAKAEQEEVARRGQYHGSANGTISCRFGASNVVEIRNNTPVEGEARIDSGPLLPGISVKTQASRDCTIEENPNWRNQWKGLKIRKTNPAAFTCTIEWTVAR